MKVLSFFAAFLTALAANPIKCQEQPLQSSNGTGIFGPALSIRPVDNEPANQTQRMARDISASHDTPSGKFSQYWATGGDQACAGGRVDKSDARKAWEQLRKSCLKMHKNTKVPRKQKQYGHTWRNFETSRRHQELIVEIYGNSVVYLCHTGHGDQNKCDPNELMRAEQMMACPGSPRLFERKEEDPEPPLLPAPGQNSSVETILFPEGEVKTNPNRWKFVREGKLWA
ncbi:hypothetical protein ANO14919_142280 [Xylariales sp. No.14919]|nr:hypothetical protein ANO14919_142280 [Xylariales sp. No.14919]